MRKKVTYGVIAALIISVFLLEVLNLQFAAYRNPPRRNGRHLAEVNSARLSVEKHREFKHLLVIFTSFKEVNTIPHHLLAREAVLRNWPSFRPKIKSVVFLTFTNSSFAMRARLAGWDVLPIKETNPAGTPCLKAMFRTAFEKYDSMLYGYSNGDLLFDSSIIRTLEGIEQKRTAMKDNVMLTGRRTDVEIDLNVTWSAGDFQGERLRRLAKNKGSLIPPYAIDYFFFTKEGCSLNWSSVKDVVIGRIAYDSYLVAMARSQRVNVIDCTKTLLAVHISERNVLSHGRSNPDALYNARLIGERFRHVQGYPTAAKLETVRDIAGDVFVVRR